MCHVYRTHIAHIAYAALGAHDVLGVQHTQTFYPDARESSRLRYAAYANAAAALRYAALGRPVLSHYYMSIW